MLFGKIIANVDKVCDQDLLLLLSRHINALLTLLLGANLQPHFIFPLMRNSFIAYHCHSLVSTYSMVKLWFCHYIILETSQANELTCFGTCLDCCLGMSWQTWKFLRDFHSVWLSCCRQYVTRDIFWRLLYYVDEKLLTSFSTCLGTCRSTCRHCSRGTFVHTSFGTWPPIIIIIIVNIIITRQKPAYGWHGLG